MLPKYKYLLTYRYSEIIHDLKSHAGQKITAHNLRVLLAEDVKTPKIKNLQEGYSLRCTPHVHGAIYDALCFSKKILEAEIRSVSSNPIVLSGLNDVRSGGNFHGQPIALAADTLAIALATLANISERRTERLLNPSLSGLPAFLSRQPGLDSGLMIAQYTAAALVSKNKILAHPASVDSIPVSASQEDFVSMAGNAVLKAKEISENVWTVLAIELLCASEALLFSKQSLKWPVLEIHKMIQDIKMQEGCREISSFISHVMQKVQNF